MHVFFLLLLVPFIRVCFRELLSSRDICPLVYIIKLKSIQLLVLMVPKNTFKKLNDKVSLQRL